MHARLHLLIRIVLPLLLVFLHCTCVRAQIRISRQVIATAVWSSTPEGNFQQLKMTATAGEVFVGTQLGDIKATVGFQQPDDDVMVNVFTLGEREITVRTYPNPTTDVVFVDLTEARGEILELELHDLHGRQLLRRRVTTNLTELTEVARLAGGSYFLRGYDHAGRPYLLGTIMVVSQ